MTFPPWRTPQKRRDTHWEKQDMNSKSIASSYFYNLSPFLSHLYTLNTFFVIFLPSLSLSLSLSPAHWGVLLYGLIEVNVWHTHDTNWGPTKNLKMWIWIWVPSCLSYLTLSVSSCFFFFLFFFHCKPWMTIKPVSSGLTVGLNGVVGHKWSKDFMFPRKASQSSSPLKQHFIFITCFPSGCRSLTDWNITQSTLIALLCS